MKNQSQSHSSNLIFLFLESFLSRKKEKNVLDSIKLKLLLINMLSNSFKIFYLETLQAKFHKNSTLFYK
jgi:hypothetical protein